ncbi:MAG TPA: glycoside hydrolase family 3 N-terminal domain-containing protein [Tepidisphaeraceae bacterium]|jgi:beta-glucosidase|nr:glycoside hydrolase family 3 N-terminal domain-containing protein [Tepidisphaeraceae bacterium]
MKPFQCLAVPVAALVLCLALLPAIAVAAAPAADRRDIEQKINTLLAHMTLAEKLGQMSQTGFPDKLTEKVKSEIRIGRWGSFYGGADPSMKAEMQRIAMKESRLGIPLIFGADLIHGFRTTFPIPLGESCSWNPELIQQAARVAAHEGAREGIHWTFSPMMDISRDPRWGRIAETLGEDPHLAGVLAAAIVRGLQGQSLDDADSIAACAKHYVGYGAAEGGRDYNTTWIPEALLRNVYLVPFAAANEAGIASYMSAFNDLNGVPASANTFTLRQVLRDEWKFDGIVVSDYESVKELIPHGYAADERDAAMKAIKAGVDMEMVSTSYYNYGKSLIDSGQLDPRLIDQSVGNILRIKFRLGLFGAKGTQMPQQRAAPTPEALDVAKTLAEQSLVLLKNDHAALPLAKSVGKVAIIGPLADSPVDQLGAWAADRHSPSRTPLTAFRDALGDSRVAYAPGLEDSVDESHKGFQAAVEAARSADVVILFLGEGADMSGEASSRAYLNLPGAQEQLAAEVAKAGKSMIAVIMAGRPLTFHDLAQKMNAVLWAWHPGSMGGPAIVDTIFGTSVPSGKLTVTFPRTVGQVPIYYDHMNTGRPAQETGPYADEKFTSKYIDERFTPEYPFGYGLSYTTFKYSNLRLSSAQLNRGGQLTISADIANTGAVTADEIVQLYTHQLVGTLTRPVRELKSFQRIRLTPGQTKTVEFLLNPGDLAYYNAQGKVLIEPGKFDVWIAPDCATGLSGEFTLQ